jgi:hypothetical protein
VRALHAPDTAVTYVQYSQYWLAFDLGSGPRLDWIVRALSYKPSIHVLRNGARSTG